MASTVGHVLAVAKLAMGVHMHVDLRAAAALPQRPKPKHYCDTADTVTLALVCSLGLQPGRLPGRSYLFLLPGRPTGTPSLPRKSMAYGFASLLAK